MENKIPVVICNRIGQEHNFKYFGQSAAYDAQAELLIKLEDKNSVSTAHIPLCREQDSNLSYLNIWLANTYKELTQMED